MTTLDERQLSVLVAMYFWQPTLGQMQAVLHGNMEEAVQPLHGLGLCDRWVGDWEKWSTTIKGASIVEDWDEAGRPDTWEL